MVKTKIKKILIAIVTIFTLLIVQVLVKDYFDYKTINKETSPENLKDLSDDDWGVILGKVTDEVNKTCPKMIDKETRLDNSIALSDRTIQYNYTMVNLEKESIDIDYFEENLKPIILNEVKTNPGLKNFRENKVTMSYYYKDKNGKFLINLKFNPDSYK